MDKKINQEAGIVLKIGSLDFFQVLVKCEKEKGGGIGTVVPNHK